jgi:hypothetical protein
MHVEAGSSELTDFSSLLRPKNDMKTKIQICDGVPAFAFNDCSLKQNNIDVPKPSQHNAICQVWVVATKKDFEQRLTRLQGQSG